ncbi:MAG: alpha/beta hydrolase [Bacillota bacterium]|nr:alpha/beta hydrolase [Bacillota bacterium]
MAVFAREKYEMIEKQLILEDDSVIHYAEGPDNGPALLLLHGQQVSWEDYRKVLPELSKQFHVFAVDYYGHGGSSKDPAKYTAKAIGTDLLFFLKTVIKKKPVIAGHSSGALLAAWIAGNDPDGVAGIVLEDGPFFSTEKGRAEHTFAWLGFEVIHRFLQEEETNYTLYSLEHHYMQTLFNQNGKEQLGAYRTESREEIHEETSGHDPENLVLSEKTRHQFHLCIDRKSAGRNGGL